MNDITGLLISAMPVIAAAGIASTIGAKLRGLKK
jgi:hypothetical protein